MESSRYLSAYEWGQVGSFSSSAAYKHNSDKNYHAAPSAETKLPLRCKFPASVVFYSLPRDCHVAVHLCDSCGASFYSMNNKKVAVMLECVCVSARVVQKKFSKKKKERKGRCLQIHNEFHHLFYDYI